MPKKKEYKNWVSRSAPVDTRDLNNEERSARAVISTETPAEVMDWSSWEIIREILVMDGAAYPEQVPLLDSHSRYSASNIKGSIRDLKVENNELVGRAYFAKKAEDEWELVREGHLTDLSAGYRTFSEDSIRLKPGEKTSVNGREYKNDYGDGKDLVIRTKWQLKEGSLVPIGADEAAKFRSEERGNPIDIHINLNEEERHMPNPKKDNSQEPVASEEQLRQAHENELKEARAQAKREAVEEYRKRQDGIDNTFIAVGIDGEARADVEKGITEEMSLDEAREIILKAGVKARTSGPVDPVKPVEPSAAVNKDEVDKFRQGFEDAVMCRAGMATNETMQNVAVGDGPKSIHDLVRACLLREGRVSQYKVAMMSADEIGRQASQLWQRADSVTPGNFSGIFIDVMNKVVGTSFDRVETTWNKWAATGSAKDFRDIYIVSKGTFSDWQKVPDGRPIPTGVFTDKYETASVDTYGRGLTIPRKAIVNDDMGFMTDLLSFIGQGAAQGIEDLVYETLVGTSLAGPTLKETSRALFNATDGNLISSSGTISHTALKTARQTLRKLAVLAPGDQGESRTRYTGLKGKYILTGVDNESDIDQFLKTPTFMVTGDTDATDKPVANIWTNLVPIYSESLQYYLDDDSSDNAWYLVADKSQGYALCRVYFLNGQQRPILRKADSGVGEPLGINMEGYLDYGVSFPEWRAAVCNDGA